MAAFVNHTIRKVTRDNLVRKEWTYSFGDGSDGLFHANDITKDDGGFYYVCTANSGLDKGYVIKIAIQDDIATVLDYASHGIITGADLRGICFDGHFIYVLAKYGSAYDIIQIDPITLLMTAYYEPADFGVGGQPAGMCFDGEFFVINEPNANAVNPRKQWISIYPRGPHSILSTGGLQLPLIKTWEVFAPWGSNHVGGGIAFDGNQYVFKSWCPQPTGTNVNARLIYTTRAGDGTAPKFLKIVAGGTTGLASFRNGLHFDGEFYYWMRSELVS